MLPLALWLACSGLPAVSCARLCLVASSRVTDEPSGIALKPSTALTVQEPTAMAKQLHTFPCHMGWVLGLGHYWAQQQSCVCHAGETLAHPALLGTD